MGKEIPSHPLSAYLRQDRMPHIWCPGCGIGTALEAFLRGIQKADVALKDYVIVSGIGCTGRVAGYVKLDSFHTTHGRAIPLATGLKLARPELKVVVFSGDGDLISIGGNHFIHAARRNMDLTVICVNNFIYGMTGGQLAPTTPMGLRSSTTPVGNYDLPFNLVHLAAAAGAVYVARWTVFHVRQLQKAMTEAINKKGFTFIEVISPCPTLFGRLNRMGQGLDHLKLYQKHSVTRHGINPAEAQLALDGEITVGKFVDIERPTLLDRMEDKLAPAGER